MAKIIIHSITIGETLSSEKASWLPLMMKQSTIATMSFSCSGVGMPFRSNSNSRTLRMYTKDIRLRLKTALDIYSANDKVNLFPILFPELKQKKQSKAKANAPSKKITPKN